MNETPSAESQRAMLRSALRLAAERRAEAKAMHEQAQRTIRAVVPQAKEAGVPVPEIAALLGLTRQGVYFLIRGNAGGKG